MTGMRKPAQNTEKNTSSDVNRERQIAKIIGKGGAVGSDEVEEVMKLQLRAEKSLVGRIDTVLGRQPKHARPSRHAWIMSAIYEKLDREQ